MHPPNVLLLYFSLLALSTMIWATSTNVTIDDQYGDPTSGQLIQYTPPEAWNKGQDCTICAAKPSPATNMYNGTWMDASFFQKGEGTNGVSGQIVQASVPFIGTAVYVQVILTGSTALPSGNSDFTFNIDNVVSGSFNQAPDGDRSFKFNQTIFARTGLSNSLHSLTIQVGLGGATALVLLDSIIYTKETDDTSTAAQNSSGPSSPTGNHSHGSNIGLIVGPIAGGVVGASLIIAILFIWCRHRNHHKHDEPDSAPHLGTIFPAHFQAHRIGEQRRQVGMKGRNNVGYAPGSSSDASIDLVQETPITMRSHARLSFDPPTSAGPSASGSSSQQHPRAMSGSRTWEAFGSIGHAAGSPPSYSELHTGENSDKPWLSHPNGKLDRQNRR